MTDKVYERTCWALLMAGLQACVSLEALVARDGGPPDDRPKVDAGGAEPDSELEEPNPDAAEPDSEVEEPDPDADVDVASDAGLGEGLDGTIDARVDAASWRPDGSISPERDAEASKPCTTNAQCAPDQVCNSSSCVPRCLGAGAACVVFQSEHHIGQLATDDAGVYWAVEPSTDPLGNRRPDAELWRLQPGHQPERIARQLTTSFQFVVRREYAYFVYSDRRASVQRVALQPDSEPTSLYPMSEPGSSERWAVGSDFLAWASGGEIWLGSPDGSAPARRIYAPGGNIEIRRLLADKDRVYFAQGGIGSSANLFARIDVTEPYAVQPIFTDWKGSYVEEVDGSVAYGNCGSSTAWCRFDLQDGHSTNLTPYYSDSLRGLTWDAHGDWFYVSRTGSAGWRLERFSLLSTGTQQDLLDSSAAGLVGPTVQTAVAREKLYFAWDTLIYALTLPPARCSADLPCASGTVCGSDNLCLPGE